MKTVIVDESICKKIEALQYEVESRKEIITYILTGSFSSQSDQFKQYQDEYKQYFIKYNKAKQEMVEQYQIPNSATWNLDFRSCVLTIIE